jgi:hypothetical protein
MKPIVAENDQKPEGLNRTMADSEFRSFTTEPKTRRHMPNATLTRKRAADLMELLFQNGLVREAPYKTVYRLVVDKADFIGMDQRVIEGYMGRPRKTLRQHENVKTDLLIRYSKTGTLISKEYSAVRTLPEKEGICQKLGYMKFDYRNGTVFLIFDHRKVPLPYHQEEMPLFNSEKSECLDVSKDDLCVSPIAKFKVDGEAGIEALQRERRERRDSKGHTQIGSKDLPLIPQR